MQKMIMSTGVLVAFLMGCGGGTVSPPTQTGANNGVVKKLKDGYVRVEGRIEGFVLSADGSKGYFTDVDHAALKIMDMQSYTILGSVKVALTAKNELNHLAISPDGTKAYITALKSLIVADIENPEKPKVLGTIPLGEHMRKVVVMPDGKHIVVLDHVDLYIFDVQNAMEPKLVGSLMHEDSVAFIEDISISEDGKRAYLLADGFHILNMEDLTLPRIISTTTVHAHNEGIVVSKDKKRAYISHSNGGMSVVNIEHEGNPSVVMTQLTAGGSDKISLSSDGTKIYASRRGSDDDSSFKVFDISDADKLTLIKDIKLIDGGGYYSEIFALSVDEKRVYIPDGGRLLIVDMK